MQSKWMMALAGCALLASGGCAHGGGAAEGLSLSPSKELSGTPEVKKGADLAALIEPAQSELGQSTFAQSDGGSTISAMAIATSDLAWSRKWSESGKTIPKIKQSRVVSDGERVQVLVFVASRPDAPTLDASSNPLSYAVDVYRPDGTLQERFDSNTCMSKGASIPAGSLAVCEGALAFELEPGDQRGRWVFKVSMAAPGKKPLVFGTSFEAF